MADTGKDTIYIDIDDEITSVIEKVRGSSEKIVALVLPKRAAVFQSIVNMKLLKRTADDAKKHIVLITSETGLLPMAGAVGLHVAKTLQSKPEIPPLPGAGAEDELPDTIMEDEEPADAEFTAENAGDRPVGELAGAAGASALAGTAGDEAIETLQLDDEDGENPAAATTAAAEAKPAKKNKKLAVPNFNKFRLRLVLGILALLLLIIGWILASSVLPKATITLTTDTSDINSNLNLNLDTAAKSVDPSTSTLPAQTQQTQKNQSQQVATTGQKNNGSTASGNVTMSAGACSGDVPNDVPAGTGVSSSGVTFITQENASFSPVISNKHCTYQANNISINAQNAGAKYNISGNFTVAGRSDVSASGSTSGGTDNIIQTVAQADIDSAASKIATQDAGSVKQQLQQQLKQAGLYPITTTFSAGTPNTTTSAKVGDQANTLTVSQTITYTMFGVKQADLKALVDNNVKDQIDSSKQVILNEGLDQANFHLNGASDKTAQVAMSTVATAGPDLKATDIKTQAAGKKSGDIKSMLRTDPGVTAVDVHFSPFWVSKAPKASKITVVFQKAAK